MRAIANPMRPTSRRRLLVGLLVLTLLVLALDLAGAPGAGALRSAGGAALGPLERLMSPSDGPGGAGADATRAAVGSTQLAQESVAGQQFRQLLAAPDLSGRALVPATVVAVGRQGAAGPERVTLDVGSHDGIRADLSVVNAGGLVGRVVEVSPWTCDVLLIGSADLVVGVRVGSVGTLGSVGSGARGTHRRPAGQLNLTVVERGVVSPGDAVTSLGSVGGSPFPPGLRVGTVGEVDDAPGDLTPTAAVRPATDITALDVVGVLLTGPRSTPRPAVTAGG
jgi:rod shape-determining protein MreC